MTQCAKVGNVRSWHVLVTCPPEVPGSHYRRTCKATRLHPCPAGLVCEGESDWAMALLMMLDGCLMATGEETNAPIPKGHRGKCQVTTHM